MGFGVTERELSEAVRELATMFGWEFQYHTYDSRRSEPGFPDLVLVRPGDWTYFVELKTERGRVKPEQEAWVDAINSTGDVAAWIWRPSDLEEIARVLR